MSLSLHTLVEFCQVDAYPDFAILLGHDNDPSTPVCGLVYLGDDAHTLHSLELCFDLGKEGNVVTVVINSKLTYLINSMLFIGETKNLAQAYI